MAPAKRPTAGHPARAWIFKKEDSIRDNGLKAEANAELGYSHQTGKVSYGVLQPSGSLTEIQVQKEVGYIQGEAGANLAPGEWKKSSKTSRMGTSNRLPWD